MTVPRNHSARGVLIISALILTAVAAVSPPPASADSADDAFIAVLQKRGIVLATPSAAIAAGPSISGIR